MPLFKLLEVFFELMFPLDKHLYEYMGDMLPENEVNKEKYRFLKVWHYLTEDNKVNIMVANWNRVEFLAKIPRIVYKASEYKIYIII